MKRSAARSKSIAAAAVIAAVAVMAFLSYRGDAFVARADVPHAAAPDSGAYADLHTFASMRTLGDLFPAHSR